MAEPGTAPPFACRLVPAELRERRNQVAHLLRERCRQQDALPNGYRLRFDLNDGILSDLAILVELERQCCPWLQFDLTVAADNGPCWLQLTGPNGTRQFLETELGLGS